ncbi:MAG: NAD(P)H-binding protein [Mycobacteriales bacterium]
MILVAGGTGFIGRAIVSALRREGHQVRVLSRGERGNPFVRDRGVTLVTGDVRDAASLATALDGIDTVVCAVQFPGHPVEVPKKGLTYDEFDRKGTENLVSAAQKAGVLRFLYVSGAGVGEGRPEEWFVAKERAEAAVRASGMSWTIVRPSWVYGPRDRSLNRLAMLARLLPVVPLTGMGKNRIRPVHVDDVAGAVATAIRTPEASEQVIEVGGPQFLPMRQVVRIMLRVMGKRRLVLPTPAGLVKLGALVLAKMPGRILSPRAVDFANGEADVDTRAMHEILGVRARPFAEGINYLAS